MENVVQIINLLKPSSFLDVMATKTWAIALILLTTALTSAAQVLYKYGAERLPEIFTNTPLIAGMVLYGTGAVMMILAFKGGDVNVLYPIFATSYVWVTLLSRFFFNEPLLPLKFVGVFSIVLGICFIGFGSKKDAEFVGVP